MIVDCIRGDVLAGHANGPVVFGVNTEGVNGSGFAGTVAMLWPGIRETGPQLLGTVIEQWPFFAIVCHSLRDGWADSPSAIREALDSIAERSPAFNVVLMGAGVVGQMSGADVFANLGAIARSKARCRVWTL